MGTYMGLVTGFCCGLTCAHCQLSLPVRVVMYQWPLDSEVKVRLVTAVCLSHLPSSRISLCVSPGVPEKSLRKAYLWKNCVSVLPSTAGGVVELDPVCGSSGLSSRVPRPSPHPLNAGWLSLAQCIAKPFLSSLLQCFNKRY